MRWKFLFLLALVSIILASGAKAGSLVQFRTPAGDMDVELYDLDKPVTVQNFLSYIRAGYYTNMVFHRWVPGFVVQGGGFYIANRHTPNAAFAPVSSFAAITNEFAVGKTYSNTYGTIAMAKVGGDPNSASSQWFFNLGNNSANLDSQNGGFTVFGRVVKGTNILNKFLNQSSGIFQFTGLGSPLNELPVLNASPTYEDLVYVDISLLNVKVVKSGSASQITWTSVAGQTNLVEFSSALPPSWQTLLTTNGNGSSFTVQDPSPSNASRFYRVRVIY